MLVIPSAAEVEHFVSWKVLSGAVDKIELTLAWPLQWPSTALYAVEFSVRGAHLPELLSPFTIAFFNTEKDLQMWNSAMVKNYPKGSGVCIVGEAYYRSRHGCEPMGNFRFPPIRVTRSNL